MFLPAPGMVIDRGNWVEDRELHRLKGSPEGFGGCRTAPPEGESWGLRTVPPEGESPLLITSCQLGGKGCWIGASS